MLLREGRFRLHQRRIQPRLERLRSKGRSNERVLGILVVESFYRPKLRRVAEYSAWCVLTLLRRPSAGRVTVGVAQARVSHWHRLGLIDSERFSPVRLATVLDLDRNYEVCYRYLSERQLLAEPDSRTVTRAYTGGAVADYVAMLDGATAAFAD